MRQQGQQPEQIKFRNILMRLRNGQITTEDWQHLLTRSAAHVSDLNSFENAIHLYPRVDDAVQYNLFKLRQGNSPIAQIRLYTVDQQLTKQVRKTQVAFNHSYILHNMLE